MPRLLWYSAEQCPSSSCVNKGATSGPAESARHRLLLLLRGSQCFRGSVPRRIRSQLRSFEGAGCLRRGRTPHPPDPGSQSGTPWLHAGTGHISAFETSLARHPTSIARRVVQRALQSMSAFCHRGCKLPQASTKSLQGTPQSRPGIHRFPEEGRFFAVPVGTRV